MADFERGQTFLDIGATNIQGVKPKFLIAMNNADFEDDIIICFIMNTEHNFHKYHLKCNKEKGKFIIEPKTFSFIIDYTSIMLKQPARYTLKEIYSSKIKLKEIADDKLQREIKNCIDFNFLLNDEIQLIKDCF